MLQDVSMNDGTSDGESEDDSILESEVSEATNPVYSYSRSLDLVPDADVQQLEKDIRAASKPLIVEPASTTRYHKILVVSLMSIICNQFQQEASNLYPSMTSKQA